MVGILEAIKQIEMENVSGGFDCGLENYGCMRDTLGHFTFKFEPGVYLIEGEGATGGWALSTILSGKDRTFEGKILFNNQEVTYREIVQNSCYVGEDSGLKKRFGLVPMTVQEQIRYGISKGLSFNNDIEQIRKMFGISEERFNRSMKYVSGERWRASMAIGYSFGKSIYCFPWINSKFIISREENLKICFDSLRAIDAIIIIPTTNSYVIERITKDYKVVKT